MNIRGMETNQINGTTMIICSSYIIADISIYTYICVYVYIYIYIYILNYVQLLAYALVLPAESALLETMACTSITYYINITNNNTIQNKFYK